jgi:hypothetical protein
MTTDDGKSGNERKVEPTKLTPAHPGESPKPDGCTCTWTPLDYGWLRGPRKTCPIDH